MTTLNWLVIFGAGISSFVMGGVWYSPSLMGRAWMKENNFNEEILRKGNHLKIFGISIALSLVMSVNLGIFLNNIPALTIKLGFAYGLLAGLWIFCGIAIVGLFERKNTRYIFINGGYCLFAMSLIGTLIGALR